MARKNPLEFLREVRLEAGKVTWPSRRETTITTVMVLIMAAVSSIFFLSVDRVIAFGVRSILGIGS